MDVTELTSRVVKHGWKVLDCVSSQLVSVTAQMGLVCPAKTPVVDMGGFDNASRGIYGNAELLWRLRMR